MHEMARVRFTAVALGVSAVLAGCGGGFDSNSNSSVPREAPLTVPKVASCAAGDKPEVALQGQVPAALRQSGFEGFNCNLELVGQYQGEGGNWSSAIQSTASRDQS